MQAKTMVFPTLLLKLAYWILYKLLFRSYGFFLKNPSSFKSSSSQPPPNFPSLSKCSLEGRGPETTTVCDFHGGLLRTQSFFPYFMLVAFEGGSIFRAFFLLLSCPILWFLDPELQLRVMVFITFVGLRVRDMESVSRAVLPKFYLENLNLKTCEVLAVSGSKLVVSRVPRVMIEGFLKEYLNVDEVFGTELQTHGSYFTGLVSGSGLLVKHRVIREHFGHKMPDIGIGSSSLHDHPFISLCKVYINSCLHLSVIGSF